MSPEELLCLFRSNVEDTDANDPLWTDEEMYSYMDEAQKQFARETDYFMDASNTDVCVVAYTAGTTFVTLSPRITKIRGAILRANGYKLTPKKYADMDKTAYGRDRYARSNAWQKSNWQSSTGTPEFIITDMEHNKGRLAPIPTVDDTIDLIVYRLPLKDLDENSTLFELEEVEYQRGLQFYMKYLAYQKNDSDVYSTALSEEGLRLFDDFITRARSDLRKKRFSSTSGTVAYGGL